jgi:transposase
VIAERYGVSVRTIQRLIVRFDQAGEDGVAPDYHLCGLDQAAKTAPAVIAAFCKIRRQHPRWGSELIRLELAERSATLPSARTVRRHLRAAGLQPAPAGRIRTGNYPLVARADRPHQGWQTDASEELHLKGRRQACWLRVVDECSGAFLQTIVFPNARWQQVSRHAIQAALRQVFGRWGRPERLRVDNGYPWGSTGEFPTEMALWLIGLDIEMIWIPPACPQQNGVVERAQATGQNWTEPHNCRTVAELQRRCDAMDRRQRERYPYRDGRSRCATYPQLAHSARAYSRTGEKAQWDVHRVWQAVAQCVVKRRVDQNGSVSLYHRSRYVGKSSIGKVVYVSLDPTGPTWVFADGTGAELRTHPADEMTAERICHLQVMCRKGRHQRE